MYTNLTNALKFVTYRIVRNPRENRDYRKNTNQQKKISNQSPALFFSCRKLAKGMWKIGNGNKAVETEMQENSKDNDHILLFPTRISCY